jgi:hypothetical protein
MENTKGATSRVALLNRASCNATAQYVNTGKIGTKFQKPLTSDSWHDPTAVECRVGTGHTALRESVYDLIYPAGAIAVG